jgi:hypothetical protein
MAKAGRNDRCPCGSGKKYKACCLPREEAAERDRLAAEQAGREARAKARRQELRKERDAIAADFAASADLRDLDDTVDAALRFVEEATWKNSRPPPAISWNAIRISPTDGSSSATSMTSGAKTRRLSPAIGVCWRSSTERLTTSTRSTRNASKTGSPNSTRRRTPDPRATIAFADGPSHADLASRDQQTHTTRPQTA